MFLILWFFPSLVFLWFSHSFSHPLVFPKRFSHSFGFFGPQFSPQNEVGNRRLPVDSPHRPMAAEGASCASSWRGPRSQAKGAQWTESKDCGAESWGLLPSRFLEASLPEDIKVIRFQQGSQCILCPKGPTHSPGLFEKKPDLPVATKRGGSFLWGTPKWCSVRCPFKTKQPLNKTRQA